MKSMGEFPESDWSPQQAAAEADRAGLSGRNTCVVVETSRFGVPGNASVTRVAPGVILGTFPGRETDTIILRPETGLVLRDPALAIRTLSVLGVDRILLLADAEATDQSGAVASMVRDHVNLSVENPLAGPNDDRFGPRFPDLSEAYDSSLRGRIAPAVGADPDGIVVALADRPDEESLLVHGAVWHELGVDAVTLGVVQCAIVAGHAGIRVAAAVAFHPVDPDFVREAVQALRSGE